MSSVLDPQSLALRAALAGTGAGGIVPELGRAEDLRHGLYIGKLCLLVGYAQASALVERQPISRLPNTPRWLLGMANVRGTITPVYDIARYLGIERRADRSQMLLLLGNGARSAALQVDGTTELVDVSKCRRHDLQAKHRQLNLLGPFFTAAYQKEGTMWFDFSVLDWLDYVGRSLLH
jgi:twitching motility protein PilI